MPTDYREEAKELTRETVKPKRKFDNRDLNFIAEYITEEFGRRQRSRKDLELQWDEIDRQLEQTPETAHKLHADGSIDKTKAWMSEIELSNQSYALETIKADVRKLLFPNRGPWFLAHSLVTDSLFERLSGKGIISGDRFNIPSLIDQEDVDMIVESTLGHWHREYDFKQQVSLAVTDAIARGRGVARLRKVKIPTFSGIASPDEKTDQTIPMLLHRPIRFVYPDESLSSLSQEGIFVGPSYIAYKWQRFTDLKMAAFSGLQDVNDENGGWRPSALKLLDADDQDQVKLLEYEGDLVVPRKTVGSMYLPGVIVTIAMTSSGNASHGHLSVVRFRFRSCRFPSYIDMVYDQEVTKKSYPTSPLRKGMPLQKGMSATYNRMLDVAAYAGDPALQYDPDDPRFAGTAGPMVYPGAKIPTLTPMSTVPVGSLLELLQVYQGLNIQYENVTGVTPARLGAQTKSHTTAFAKNVELQTGASRTVDFVDDLLDGPLTQLLSREYQMTLELLQRRKVSVFAWKAGRGGGFVDVSADILPKKVRFEVFGAGTPSERVEFEQRKLQGLQLVFQIEQLQAQLAATGAEPEIDFSAAKREILTEAGWENVDEILGQTSSDVSKPLQGQIPGVSSNEPEIIL